MTKWTIRSHCSSVGFHHAAFALIAHDPWSGQFTITEWWNFYQLKFLLGFWSMCLQKTWGKDDLYVGVMASVCPPSPSNNEAPKLQSGLCRQQRKSVPGTQASMDNPFRVFWWEWIRNVCILKKLKNEVLIASHCLYLLKQGIIAPLKIKQVCFFIKLLSPQRSGSPP